MITDNVTKCILVLTAGATSHVQCMKMYKYHYIKA